jgi:hypothetical protein
MFAFQMGIFDFWALELAQELLVQARLERVEET